MAKFGDAVKEIRRMKEDTRSFPMVMPAIVQAFEDALAEINVLRSEFELYKTEATKKEKFLLDRMDQVMQTHAANTDKRLSVVEESLVWAQNDIALLKKPGKTNNNMKG